MAQTESQRKRRRSAEDARRLILDATEKRLEEVGPESVRLKDIAAQLGVSHTLILHHFGTRARLLDVVVQRRVATVRERLMAALAADGETSERLRRLLEHAFEALADPVHLRVLAWLGLARQAPVRLTPVQTLRRIAEALHEHRLANEAGGDHEPPALEDSIFVVLLACSAVAGMALLEPMLMASAGLVETPEAEHRYREWLRDLLVRQVEGRD